MQRDVMQRDVTLNNHKTQQIMHGLEKLFKAFLKQVLHTKYTILTPYQQPKGV